ncbi:MAG: hypothetical protein V1724_02380, partial [Chloroflexota bacterium]
MKRNIIGLIIVGLLTASGVLVSGCDDTRSSPTQMNQQPQEWRQTEQIQQESERQQRQIQQDIRSEQQRRQMEQIQRDS